MQKQYWIVIVYLFLILIGIPWYWPDDIQLLVLGVPVWVFVAVVVSIITSLFTAFILLRYPWKTDINADE